MKTIATLSLSIPLEESMDWSPSYEKTTEKTTRLKGESLLDFPSNFTVIDIETTGLMPTYCEIIEIGAVKVRNWEIVDTFQALIYPILDYDSYKEEIINDYEDDDIYDEDDYDEDDDCPDELLNDLENYIPYKIEEMTGLTIYDLITKGEQIDKVLEDFHNFIGDNEIIMAHNANFDINFIYDNLLSIHNKHFNNDFIDTLRLSKRLFPDFENHKLKTLVSNLNLDVTVSHRSIDDCFTCFEVYKKCHEHVTSNFLSVQEWLNSLKKNYSQPSKQVIIPTSSENFDKESIIFDKVCVMTGALSNGMHKKEVMQAIVNLGGHVADNVTKKTEVLIVGQETYDDYLKGIKTGKLKKASELIEKGQEILIISESDFFELI